MMIEYYLINPTENITALVVTPVAVELQRETALQIMKIEPTCEQVGFVTILADHVELQMAGGEFCGNATMSAAALWSYINKNKQQGSRVTEEYGKNSVNTSDPVQVKASGADGLINVDVRELTAEGVCSNLGSYVCSVNMPRPVSVKQMLLNYEGRDYDVTAVDFGGILHLVTEEKFDRMCAEGAIKYWNREFRADAIGLMQLDGDILTPLVYVPGADTMFWENSCASGTTAVGAYLSLRDRCDIKRGLIQPGGTLVIASSVKGELVLTGHVNIFYDAPGEQCLKMGALTPCG